MVRFGWILVEGREGGSREGVWTEPGRSREEVERIKVLRH